MAGMRAHDTKFAVKKDKESTQLIYIALGKMSEICQIAFAACETAALKSLREFPRTRLQRRNDVVVGSIHRQRT